MSTPTRLTAPLPSTPAEMAARYEAVAAHCSAASAAGNIEQCLRDQDEMAMCRCQLEQAGRLDLIGGGV